MIPFVIRPREGEQFSFWLRRYAFALGCSVATLWWELELADEPAASAVPSWLGATLPAELASRLSSATGLPVTALTAMTIDAFNGIALDDGLDLTARETRQQAGSHQWAYYLHSPVCPHCLIESGFARNVWRLPWCAVCPIHKVVLADACPRCRQPVLAGRANRIQMARVSHVHDPMLCAQTSPDRTAHQQVRRACGFSFKELEVRPASDADLTARATVDQMLSADSVLLGGSWLSPSAGFQLLRDVAMLLRSVARLPEPSDTILDPIRDHQRGASRVDLRLVPHSTEMAAALTTAAVEILNSPEPGRSAAHLIDLVRFLPASSLSRVQTRYKLTDPTMQFLSLANSGNQRPRARLRSDAYLWSYIRDFIERCDADGVLTSIPNYQRWSRSRGSAPSSGSFKRLGNWEQVIAFGRGDQPPESREPLMRSTRRFGRPPTYSVADCEAAILRAQTQLGRPPNQQDYHRWRLDHVDREALPTIGTIKALGVSFPARYAGAPGEAQTPVTTP